MFRNRFYFCPIYVRQSSEYTVYSRWILNLCQIEKPVRDTKRVERSWLFPLLESKFIAYGIYFRGWASNIVNKTYSFSHLSIFRPWPSLHRANVYRRTSVISDQAVVLAISEIRLDITSSQLYFVWQASWAMVHVSAVGVHVPYPCPSRFGMLRVVARVVPCSPGVPIEVNRSLLERPGAVRIAIVNDKNTSAASFFKNEFW